MPTKEPVPPPNIPSYYDNKILDSLACALNLFLEKRKHSKLTQKEQIDELKDSIDLIMERKKSPPTSPPPPLKR